MSETLDVTLENRTNTTIDLVVYEADNRHVKWVARLGRSSDRDLVVPRQDEEGREQPPQRIPPGVAVADQSLIGKAGMVHSPIVKLTTKQYEELVASHNGEMIAKMVEAQDLVVTEPVRRPTKSATKAKEPADA